MKHLLILLFSFPLSNPLLAQWDCMNYVEIENKERSHVSDNVGSLSTRLFPKNNPSNSYDSDAYCFMKSLWLAGFDFSGNLKLAANRYPDPYSMEYFPGPIDKTSFTPLFANCSQFKNIWKFTAEEISEFRSKFELGILNSFNIPEDMLDYPAKGNYWYEENYGIVLKDDHAPFVDINSNGIYNPLEGDYPIALKENPCFTPYQFTYAIYNDIAEEHTGTQGSPLGVEIHLTTYLVEKDINSILNSTSFQRVVVQNKSPDVITDFRVGCFINDITGTGFYDDLIGCDTLNHLSYTYSKDGIEESDGSTGVMVHMNLNKEMHSFVPLVYYPMGNPSPPNGVPLIAQQYYEILDGYWKDGTPISIGGNGYDQNNPEVTKFAFHDKPSDTEGWSLQTELINTAVYYHGVISIIEPDFYPGDLRIFDFAEIVLIDDETTGIEKIDSLDILAKEIKEFYSRNTEDNLLEVSQYFSNLHIYPNPASDKISFLENQGYPFEIDIWNMNGKLITARTMDGSSCAIDISNYAKGLYLVKKTNERGDFQLGKFVKQ